MLIQPAPAPRLLLGAVDIVVAVPVEHVREHRLRHRRPFRDRQARERHALRERRVGERRSTPILTTAELQALQRLERAGGESPPRRPRCRPRVNREASLAALA